MTTKKTNTHPATIKKEDFAHVIELSTAFDYSEHTYRDFLELSYLKDHIILSYTVDYRVDINSKIYKEQNIVIPLRSLHTNELVTITIAPTSLRENARGDIIFGKLNFGPTLEKSKLLKFEDVATILTAALTSTGAEAYCFDKKYLQFFKNSKRNLCITLCLQLVLLAAKLKQSKSSKHRFTELTFLLAQCLLNGHTRYELCARSKIPSTRQKNIHIRVASIQSLENKVPILNAICYDYVPDGNRHNISISKNIFVTPRSLIRTRESYADWYLCNIFRIRDVHPSVKFEQSILKPLLWKLNKILKNTVDLTNITEVQRMIFLQFMFELWPQDNEIDRSFANCIGENLYNSTQHLSEVLCAFGTYVDLRSNMNLLYDRIVLRENNQLVRRVLANILYTCVHNDVVCDRIRQAPKSIKPHNDPSAFDALTWNNFILVDVGRLLIGPNWPEDLRPIRVKSAIGCALDVGLATHPEDSLWHLRKEYKAVKHQLELLTDSTATLPDSVSNIDY